MPAVEEILGIHYPGYYTDINEVAECIADSELIQEITNYLRKIDKTKYSLNYFVDTLQDVL